MKHLSEHSTANGSFSQEMPEEQGKQRLEYKLL